MLNQLVEYRRLRRYVSFAAISRGTGIYNYAKLNVEMSDREGVRVLCRDEDDLGFVQEWVH